MKQQFIGLQHCKCGMSWKRDMVFCLERRYINGKPKQQPAIRRNKNDSGDTE